MAMIAKALLIAAAHTIPVFRARRLDFDQIEWNAIAHGGSRKYICRTYRLPEQV
jgi:hypothetical protein